MHAVRAMNAAPHHDAQDEVTISGVQEQLALIQPQALRRLEQPLRSGFADRATARKGLEVAAGFAIADRLGSIPRSRLASTACSRTLAGVMRESPPVRP